MQPNELKYFLIVNEVETELIFSPTGWDETLLSWKRSEKYYGLIRSFSAPMVFVKDGAYIIKKEFYTNGLKGDIKIRIEQFNPRVWKYYPIFVGSLDMSTFESDTNGVSITVMESGIGEKVKAYENVTYEISLSDPEAVTVQLPGIGLTEKAATISASQFFQFTFDKTSAQLASNIYKDEIVNNYISVQNTFFNDDPANSQPENWIVRANQKTTVTLTGNVKGVYRKNSQFSKAYIGFRTNSLRYFQMVDLAILGENRFDVDFNFTNIELDEGDVLYFGVYQFLRLPTPGQDTPARESGWVSVEEADIHITNNITTEITNCLAFTAKTLFERLIAKINGFHIPTQSFILSDFWSNLLITSGDAIRGIDSPVIKTSFVDFFDSINSLTPIGFSVDNGVPTLEDRSYYMRPNLVALQIGEVKNLRVTVATDYVYNTIKIGYQDQKYERVLGREEYNVEQNYTTPITRIQKELNLVSKYRADQLGIDDLRLTPPEDNEDEKDKESDNNVFFIQALKTETPKVYTVENLENYKEVNGIESRSFYYNLGITPKKNLLRHGSLIRSFLHHYEGRHISFQSATKNTDLTTVSTSNEVVKERSSILVSNLGEPIFMPLLATFSYPIDNNVSAVLNDRASGIVVFSHNGYEYRGYIVSVSTDVAKDTEQEFIILLSSSNNILNLVD